MRAAVDFGLDNAITRRLLEAKQNALDAMAAKVLRDESTIKWALIGPVRCTYTTPKALLVRLDDVHPDEVGTWIPRSQLHPEENEINKQGDTGMLVIPEWLAKEKGWL